MVLCDFCGINKERIIHVYFEDNKFPENWCISCMNKYDDYNNEVYGAEKIDDVEEDEGFGL